MTAAADCAPQAEGSAFSCRDESAGAHWDGWSSDLPSRPVSPFSFSRPWPPCFSCRISKCDVSRKLFHSLSVWRGLLVPIGPSSLLVLWSAWGLPWSSRPRSWQPSGPEARAAR